MPCHCISWLSRVTSGTSRFLWTMATRFSQYHANFLAGPVRWYGCETATGRPRQHHQKWFAAMRSPSWTAVSNEWVATCWRHAHVTAGVHSVDVAKCVDTHGLLKHHIHAVQSGFSGSHTGGRLNLCRRAEQHGSPHTLLRRSRARQCCLPEELFILFRNFRDLGSRSQSGFSPSS